MLQPQNILLVGGGATLGGLLVMALCSLLRKKLLRLALPERDKSAASSAPLWGEVGLGVVLTGAVFFFSMYCFASEFRLRISIPVTYGACVLCGIGCFLRTRAALNSLGITKDDGANPEPVAVFPEERRFLVIQAFFSLALAVFLAGLLTLGCGAYLLKAAAAS